MLIIVLRTSQFRPALLRRDRHLKYFHKQNEAIHIPQLSAVMVVKRLLMSRKLPLVYSVAYDKQIKNIDIRAAELD
jgi:hypothetical protein